MPIPIDSQITATPPTVVAVRRRRVIEQPECIELRVFDHRADPGPELAAVAGRVEVAPREAGHRDEP